jgi:hypothetical protein
MSLSLECGSGVEHWKGRTPRRWRGRELILINMPKRWRSRVFSLIKRRRWRARELILINTLKRWGNSV